MLHIEKCPICGNSQIEPKMTCKDYFVSQETFSLYACRNCRFVFTQDAPAGADAMQYYKAQDYISHSDTHKGLINKAYHQVRKVMLQEKVRLAADGKKTGDLLDVGCGTGYFAGAMKEKGWEVTGIEPSEEASKIARDKFNINILAPERLGEISENQFNTITLWHVLEHLENLNESMARFSKLLKENGKLIIAVPNADSYDAKKYRNYWAAYDVPRHLWHFSPNTLTLLAQNHGFKITAIHPMPFDAFYISMLSEKYKKHAFASIRGMFFGFISFVGCLFNKRRSSSLIYILQK